MPGAVSASSPIGSDARSALAATTRLIGRSYLRREFEVALVVPRDAEQRAGAVIHQHEVRDVDRQPPFGIERVHDLDAMS